MYLSQLRTNRYQNISNTYYSDISVPKIEYNIYKIKYKYAVCIRFLILFVYVI